MEEETDPNSGTVTLMDANTGDIIKQTSIPGWTGGGSSSLTATEQKQQAVSDMNTQLAGIANSYGNVSPQDWQKALQAWLSAGFSKSDFIDNFGQYADANRGDFYQAYGFKNPNPTWVGSTYVGKGSS